MCEICQRRSCPPRCPNYSSLSNKATAFYGVCSGCGAVIRYGDVSFRKSGTLICNYCYKTLYKHTKKERRN